MTEFEHVEYAHQAETTIEEVQLQKLVEIRQEVLRALNADLYRDGIGLCRPVRRLGLFRRAWHRLAGFVVRHDRLWEYD